MKQVVKHLLIFILWNIAVGLSLVYLDPAIGLPLSLLLAAWLLWGYLLVPSRGESKPRRFATLRLRRLEGPALRWSLAAVPVLLLLSWAMGDVYIQLVPVPPETLNPFESLMRTPSGRLAIAVFAIGIAPLVEEFVFRGLIQRILERRFGSGPGIAMAAALFAAVHVLPWVFPLHFFLGLAFGLAVFATRSIWTGVILHAANNTVAMAGVALRDGEPETTGTLWEIGLTADLSLSVLLLLIGLVAAVWIGRKLLAAGRNPRLRTA